MSQFDTALVSILRSQGVSGRRAAKLDDWLDDVRPCGFTADSLASIILTFASSHEHLAADSPPPRDLLARVRDAMPVRLFGDSPQQHGM